MTKSMFRLTGGSKRAKIRNIRSEGDKWMRLRDWPKAIEFYQKYLEFHSRDAAILVQVGHAFKELKQLEPARDAYQRAVTAAPGDSDAEIHLKAILHQLAQDGGAAREFGENLPQKQVVEFFGSTDNDVPPPGASHHAQADWARDQENWLVAAEHYRLHLTDHLYDYAIWLQFGHVLRELSCFDEALHAYKIAKSLEKEPSDVDVHMANLLMRLGRATEPKPIWAGLYQKGGEFLLRDW